MLADVFENFRNMALKTYELDSAKLLWGPESAWQAVLKETKVKLDLLTDIKGAEATCVKIATEMKKCSRLKEMSNFNVLLNFQPI